MPLDNYNNIGSLVEPERVHKACYADEQIFEKELENIFYKSWIYIGHESQVPNPGDYWTTWVGRERMIICRDEKGNVHVLYNRCPHRGTLICNNLHGFATIFTAMCQRHSGVPTTHGNSTWMDR